jgi:hypothetical protein
VASKDQVIAYLRPDEPDYAAAAASLGADVAPVLEELVAGDVRLASKAASLAGFVAAETARPALTVALSHPSPIVRTAAAASLERHAGLAAELARPLLIDPDASVRKRALRAVETAQPAGYRDAVRARVAEEPIPALRELAERVASQLS